MTERLEFGVRIDSTREPFPNSNTRVTQKTFPTLNIQPRVKPLLRPTKLNRPAVQLVRLEKLYPANSYQDRKIPDLNL